MPRIAWVDDADAQGQLAETFEKIRSARGGRISDILRTLSLRPDFLDAIYTAGLLHSSDGALSRAQHEMIASYVSALTKCRY